MRCTENPPLAQTFMLSRVRILKPLILRCSTAVKILAQDIQFRCIRVGLRNNGGAEMKITFGAKPSDDRSPRGNHSRDELSITRTIWQTPSRVRDAHLGREKGD